MAQEETEYTDIQCHVDVTAKLHRKAVLEAIRADDLRRIHRNVGRANLEDVALGPGPEVLVPASHVKVRLLRWRNPAVIDLADREVAEVQPQLALDDLVGVDAAQQLRADGCARICPVYLQKGSSAFVARKGCEGLLTSPSFQ